MKKNNYIRETENLIIVQTEKTEVQIEKESGKVYIIPMQIQKTGIHDRLLRELAYNLIRAGIHVLRVDLKDFKYNDNTLRLACGNRRYDLVFMYKGELYQCELKPAGKVMESRTWEQLKDMAKTAENLIFLVNKEEVEIAKQIQKEMKELWKMRIYSPEELLRKILEKGSL